MIRAPYQRLRRRFPRWSTAALFLVAGVAAGCGSGAPEMAPEAAPPLVEALPARHGSLPLEERLSGVVRARNQVAIHPEITAPVVQVLVRNGDTVKAGQPIVRLDDTAYRDQVRQGQASLQLAESGLAEAEAQVAEVVALVTRNRVLAEQELISQLELETQEAQLAAAKASAARAAAQVAQAKSALEERRTELARTVVKAPVPGKVGRRNVEVGTLATPSTVLFILGDFEELTVEVSLTEGMLAYVEEGQPVLVSSSALGGQPLRAELSRISPFLAQGSFSTVGEIDLQNVGGKLRPGMFVSVAVLYGESESATLVPLSALWENPRSGRQGVFVVDGSFEEPPPPQKVQPGEEDAPVDPAAIAERDSEARPVTFRDVEVVAEGRSTVGVRGVEQGEWVVTVGQNLIRQDDDAQARVRPASWQRILDLQTLQKEDLLKRFLDKQQRLAQTIGAELPTVAEMIEGAAGRRSRRSSQSEGAQGESPRPEVR